MLAQETRIIALAYDCGTRSCFDISLFTLMPAFLCFGSNSIPKLVFEECLGHTYSNIRTQTTGCCIDC